MLNRQNGFGLVELLIGMVIALIILAAASTALLSSLTANRDSIRMARLDQELRQVMTMVTRDLRRATSWDPAVDVARVGVTDSLKISSVDVGNASVTSVEGNLDQIGAKAIGGTLVYYDGTTLHRASITAYDSSTETYTVSIATAWDSDPVTAGVQTDILTNGLPAGAWSILRPEMAVTTDAVAGTPGECLLFAYDTDASGTYASNEYFGYRYNDSDDAVAIRTSGASGNTCTTGGTWENLTDENSTAITDFSVTITPVSVTNSGLTVTVREFTINITGHLIADPSVVRTLQETIRVRNDGLT
jgi:prepilin-type N-terminal cleavage/methylation domain-containing protein